VRAVAATQTSVSVAWSASSDNVGVAGYGLYRGTSRTGTTTQTSSTFSGLTCGTAYQIGVDAYDAVGNRSQRADLTVTTAACSDTQPPTKPANVAASTRTATSIALAWSPATDNVGVAGYGLYRAGSLVGTTAGTTGIFSGLSCGTNYTLAVDAFDSAGNRSSQAVVMVATTACADTQPPSTPTNLVASSVTQTGLTLSWTASNDNVGVVGYDVLRNGTKIGSTTATTSPQTSLSCGTSYTQAVVAFDAAGNRSQPAQISTSTAACASSPASGTVYLSPSGNDAAACTQAAPCKSMQRGFAVAQAGQTVELAGGTYPQQSLSNAHKAVTFRAAAGANAFVTTQISLTCTTGLTIQGINSKAIAILAGNDNLKILGGSFGGGSYQTGVEEDPGVVGDVGSCSTGDTSNNVLIDGASFHDYMWQMDPGSAHPDCLQFYGGSDGVTIRNSTFQRCADSFIGAYPDFGDIRNVLIENNTFRDLGDRTYWASQWGQPGHPYRCEGITIRGNRFEPNNPNALGPYSSLRTECYGMVVENNTFQKGPGSSCSQWTGSPYYAVWRGNTFTLGGACGS
jgi:chitodextrinase